MSDEFDYTDIDKAQEDAKKETLEDLTPAQRKDILAKFGQAQSALDHAINANTRSRAEDIITERAERFEVEHGHRPPLHVISDWKNELRNDGLEIW